MNDYTVELEDKDTMSIKQILLVDGHGLAFRGFYALPEMTAPDGTPTQAIVGFFSMLKRLGLDSGLVCSPLFSLRCKKEKPPKPKLRGFEGR